MSDSNLDAAVEFADNPEARCPCVILVDTSGSMQGDKINALNEGLKAFKKDLAADPLAALRVEIAVISFDSEIRVQQDFATVDRFDPPELHARGLTHMGSGMLKALEMSESRKALYNANGVKYYRPWIFLITDGKPEGETDQIFEEAARRVHDAESNKRAVVYAVGVEGADMDRLSQLCVRTPLRLKGLSFVEMFVWLSRSTQQVAKSKPDEQVALQPPGWGTV
jgi:uncharacterized protein YegL